MTILVCAKRWGDAASGVEKKIDQQIRAFQNLGHRVYYTAFEDGRAVLAGPEGRISLFSIKKRAGILSGYLYFERALAAAARLMKDGPDLCYIRKPLCSPLHLRNLRRLCRRGCAVAEEIPTYPYDGEFIQNPSLASKIWLFIDRLFRGRMKRHVRFFVTYTDYASIFGLPAIQIENCAVPRAAPPHSPTGKAGCGVIAVSNMNFWHGYDRLLRGLAGYLATDGARRDIRLFMVGDGPMRPQWEALSAELGLSPHVTFTGKLEGAALDAAFAGCDIGAASLANHRKGLFTASELKIREYFARGLPFIYATRDRAAQENPACCLPLPADDSDVDFKRVLDFCARVKADEGLSGRMREYAETHMSWESQLAEVLRQTAPAKPQSCGHSKREKE